MKIGEQHGDLTLEVMQNETIGQFRCSCGNVFIVAAEDVKQGNVSSCGCKTGRFTDNLAPDGKGLAPSVNQGERYGRLTVLRYLGDRKVEVRCDCGTIFETRTFQMKNKHKKKRIIECADCRKERRKKLREQNKDKKS